MQDRVMHVQYVQIFVLGDLDDLRRQRQVIKQKLEERIIKQINLMESQPIVQPAQPRRQRVADEMDVVAAFGQFTAQLGADNPAAAVCEEDCNADVHKNGEWRVGSRE